MDASLGFIPLDAAGMVYLFLVGFVGGLVSGFIGSGGAFVLTPAMMSMGVPGIVAVASQHVPQVPQGAGGRDQARQVRPGRRQARPGHGRLGGSGGAGAGPMCRK